MKNIEISIVHIDNCENDLSFYEDAYTIKFKDEKRKRESLVARSQLDLLCIKIYQKNLSELGFSKDAFGRPFFLFDSNIHCSITHSFGWVIVALSNTPIGIDFEKIIPEQKEDLKLAFTENEWRKVANDSNLVFTLFSMKESYSKLIGKGFSIDPRLISISPESYSYSRLITFNSKDFFIFTLICLQKINSIKLDKYLSVAEFNETQKYQKYAEEYNKTGVLFLKEILCQSKLPNYEKMMGFEEVLFYEKDGVTLRSVYAVHTGQYFRDWLSNQRWIYDLCKPILGEDFYVHQSKINIKNKQDSSIWPYHRDYPFWRNFDNIVENKMLNFIVYLDDVTKGSGELNIIPYSHLDFLPHESQNFKQEYSIDGSASSDLLFGFSEDDLAYFVSRYSVETNEGGKGSALLFNPDCIHGSGSSNIDFGRKMLIITFNSCDNLPVKKSDRPEYLSSTNFNPLKWTK